MEKLAPTTAMKRLALLLVGCFFVAPLAAAPVLGQISFRPLTIGHSLKVAKAFGADDEDCVYEIRRVPRPDGVLHPKRTLICND